ncbi:hypothetical protein TNCV_1972211 [Trichonephila clavipes]|nr:hypothetical protein TNCV_1972211 [Trichonephila clavipes]
MICDIPNFGEMVTPEHIKQLRRCSRREIQILKNWNVCVGYVEKRMGTRLRALKLEMKDAYPQHGLCPTNEDTWCEYNRAITTGEVYKHKNTLPSEFLNCIKNVYRELSTPNILAKCLHESFHYPPSMEPPCPGLTTDSRKRHVEFKKEGCELSCHLTVAQSYEIHRQSCSHIASKCVIKKPSIHNSAKYDFCAYKANS